MKKIRIIAAGLVVLMAAACSSTGDNVSKEAKALLPSSKQVDSVSYLVGVNFGSFIKGYNLGDLNMKEIERGIKDFIKAEGDPRDSSFAKQFKISPEEMQQVMSSYMEKRQQYVAKVNEDAEKEFLESIEKKENVQKTESGILYIIDNPGTGEKITNEDTLYVHYKGSLKDGKVFDQTQEGGPSAKFTLAQVIPGWQEGMKLIGEGGKITLYIPSALGYGPMGHPQGGIEPYSPLVFEVQIDSVKRAKPVEAK